MKYLALGILQEDPAVAPALGYVAFQDWKLLYYALPSEMISVREQIQIHFREIQNIFAKYHILPFGFGIFFGSEKEMASLLVRNQADIAEEWERISGTGEVRVAFAAGVIRSALPEKLVSRKPGVTFWQKKYQQNAQIQYFKTTLREKANVLDCKAKAKDEKLIFDFLIQKSEIAIFYQHLAETLAELHIFEHEVSKPTAPFNFIKLTLNNER